METAAPFILQFRIKLGEELEAELQTREDGVRIVVIMAAGSFIPVT